MTLEIRVKSAGSDRLPVPSGIVVRGTNWVGDTIISLPAAKRLRALFPESTITFWVKESLAPLVRTAGIADEVLCFSDRTGGPVSRSLTMSNALRAGKFDMAILFQNAFESAFTAWLARIPLRIGFPTDLRGLLLSMRVPLREELRQRHQVYYYLAIADFVGERIATGRPADATNDRIGLGLPRTPIRGRSACGPPAGKHVSTRIWSRGDRSGRTVGSDDKSSRPANICIDSSSGDLDREERPDCSISLDRKHLTDAGDVLAALGIDLHRPLFCLCPGSANSEAKRWPPDYFAALADLLIEQLGGNAAFVGSPGERGLVERIQGRMRTQGSVNLAGKTDMVAAMAMMSLSRMVISNDTGSAHLAVAASVPVLTIFGPTVAGATAPFGPTAHIVQGEAPCAPCRHFRCPRPDHLCMRSLDPARVFGRVQEILADALPVCNRPASLPDR